MKRSPKQRGTEAEVMARSFLADDGWTDCERIVQHGVHDQGDLLVCRNPRIIAEVKGGAQAEAASHTVIGQWLADADREAVNAGADLGVLIVRRFRRPVELWDAVMAANDWMLILSGDEVLPTDAPWALRASLADWSRMALAWVEGLT